jgi:hypothetical protein
MWAFKEQKLHLHHGGSLEIRSELQFLWWDETKWNDAMRWEIHDVLPQGIVHCTHDERLQSWLLLYALVDKVSHPVDGNANRQGHLLCCSRSQPIWQKNIPAMEYLDYDGSIKPPIICQIGGTQPHMTAIATQVIQA